MGSRAVGGGSILACGGEVGHYAGKEIWKGIASEMSQISVGTYDREKVELEGKKRNQIGRSKISGYESSRLLQVKLDGNCQTFRSDNSESGQLES